MLYSYTGFPNTFTCSNGRCDSHLNVEFQFLPSERNKRNNKVNKRALRPGIAHLSKQAKGQIHYLNKPDYWLKVKG